MHHFSHMADHGGGRLGEEDRRLGIFELDRARPRAFFDMFLVIDPEKNDVFTRRGKRRD